MIKIVIRNYTKNANDKMDFLLPKKNIYALIINALEVVWEI